MLPSSPFSDFSWEGINLSPLHDNPNNATSIASTSSLLFPVSTTSSILMNVNNSQDYLARTFSPTNNTTSMVVSSIGFPPLSSSPSLHFPHHPAAPFSLNSSIGFPPLHFPHHPATPFSLNSSMGFSPPPLSPSLHLPHSPATAFSSNSSMGGPDQFRCLNNQLHHQVTSRPTPSIIVDSTFVNRMNMIINPSNTTRIVSSFPPSNNINNPFESSLFSFGKKRSPCGNISGGNDGEKREKREMKNRASASRSRVITNSALVNPMNTRINSSGTTSNVSSFLQNNNINNPSESSLSSFGKKRSPCDNISGGNDDDKREKIKMRNRASADRSRARKKVYVQELEEENKKLRKQLEQTGLAAAAKLPKKCSHRRTSTAPF